MEKHYELVFRQQSPLLWIQIASTCVPYNRQVIRQNTGQFKISKIVFRSHGYHLKGSHINYYTGDVQCSHEYNYIDVVKFLNNNKSTS